MSILAGQFSGPVYHYVAEDLWEAPDSPTVDVPFGSILNPFGVDVWILADSFFEMTVVSSGASTIDIGVNAAATTKGDTVIDGASGASTLRNITGASDGGTNGGRATKWAAGAYLNIAEASGAVEGLKGRMHVIWTPA